MINEENKNKEEDFEKGTEELGVDKEAEGPDLEKETEELRGDKEGDESSAEKETEEIGLQKVGNKAPTDNKSEIVPEEVVEVLNSLPKEKRMVIMKAMVHSGPLPHPDLLNGYEKTLPGAADRILIMTEKEQAHRHEVDQQLLEYDRSDLRRGQNFGFVLALILILAALVIVYLGHEVLAGVIFGTTLLGVLVIYVLRKMPVFDSKKNNK